MKRILLFAILLFSVNSKAQDTLGMGPITAGSYMDTVLEGTSDTYTVWVKNLSAFGFNDYLILHTAVLNGTTLDTISTYSSVLPDSITPGGSIPIVLNTTYNVTPVGYKYGIDVIVIWPVSASGSCIIKDSLYFNVLILRKDGTVDLGEYLKVYPNPVVSELNIDKASTITIEEVRVYDASGQLVIDAVDQSIIYMESLAPGIYTIDIRLAGNTHKIVKIIKQKT